jgi:hypothetical protein
MYHPRSTTRACGRTAWSDSDSFHLEVLMSDDAIEAKIRELKFWTGKGELTLDEIAVIQPGLARIMPEIGDRAWKLYYAGQAQNWPLARYQAKEARKLMELGGMTRPKYAGPLNEYIENDWKPIEDAIEKQDLDAFTKAYAKAIESANAWHEEKDKPYIVWKVPDHPPPDLDLTPRKKS